MHWFEDPIDLCGLSTIKDVQSFSSRLMTVLTCHCLRGRRCNRLGWDRGDHCHSYDMSSKESNIFRKLPKDLYWVLLIVWTTIAEKCCCNIKKFLAKDSMRLKKTRIKRPLRKLTMKWDKRRAFDKMVNGPPPKGRLLGTNVVKKKTERPKRSENRKSVY